MDKETRLKCVLGALSVFGENSRAAIISELAKQGVSLNAEEFDLEQFCSALESLLGHWSDFIFLKITESLCEQSGMSLEILGLSGRAKIIERSRLLKELFLKIEGI